MFKNVWNNAAKIKKYKCIDYEKIIIFEMKYDD